METTYLARAYKTLGADASESEWVRDLASKYETTDKTDLLGWVISIISEHGSDGDGTIDWIEAWSDDPDDAWSIEAEANSETIETASREMLEEVG